MRCRLYGYQYREIIRSLMSVYFCGGSCIEDVTTHLMYHLSLHPTLRTCSADTILRAINCFGTRNTRNVQKLMRHLTRQLMGYVIYREIKIQQTLHKTLHSPRIALIIRTLYCVGFEAKILHKPCIKPYMGTKSQRDKESKRRGLPQPLPKGKGVVAALMHRTWGSFLGESKR